MRPLPNFALCLAFLGCAPHEPPAASAGGAGGPFRYDAASGECRGPSGKTGYNAPDPAVLFAGFDEAENTYAAADAECVDFSGFDFGDRVGVAYPNLVGWNFKGARFDGARMPFIYVRQASLQGADLRGVANGYGSIDGQGDEHTEAGDCELSADYGVACFK